jgi:hypothetical protein
MTITMNLGSFWESSRRTLVGSKIDLQKKLVVQSWWHASQRQVARVSYFHDCLIHRSRWKMHSIANHVKLLLSHQPALNLGFPVHHAHARSANAGVMPRWSPERRLPSKFCSSPFDLWEILREIKPSARSGFYVLAHAKQMKFGLMQKIAMIFTHLTFPIYQGTIQLYYKQTP